MAAPLDFYLMSNLSPQTTGLPFVVWISVRGTARHDVQVKVTPGPKAAPEEFVSVAIRPDVHVVLVLRCQNARFCCADHESIAPDCMNVGLRPAKRVPLSLIAKIPEQREFHRPDWPAVKASIAGDIPEFDLFFDFVVILTEVL